MTSNLEPDEQIVNTEVIKLTPDTPAEAASTPTKKKGRCC